LSNLTDAELYQLLGAEDQQRDAAFKEIYNRHSQRIFLYCRKFIGENAQADDIFQEPWIRLMNSFERDRVITNFPAFLLRIARNLCLHHRRDAKQTFVSIEGLDLTHIENPMESEELAKLVTRTLDLLPEAHREAFVLQAYSGLSYIEIAEVTGVPVSTVRNRVVRAKHKVRSVVTRYFTEVL
jgi:RNA polymerase sigma factor (sigma-70 family)